MSIDLSMSRNTTKKRDLFGAEPRYASAGYAIIITLVVTSLAALIDNRVLDQDNIWIKPIKFQIAVAAYFLTLAFFLRFAPSRIIEGRRYRAYSTLIVFCGIAELVWISRAAMYGTTSHFNTTPVGQALYGAAGIMAVILTSASFVSGWIIWRNLDSYPDMKALVRSIALGLILTALMTLPVAATLAAQTGHYIGTPVTHARLPLMGWSFEVGDLRVAHFFATHAMHFIPAMGLAAHLLLRGRAQTGAVYLGAALYCALTIHFFVRALQGLPFIQL